MLAHTVSSTDATKDGAFVRHTADGTVTTLKATGHYKSVAFDEAGRQIAFQRHGRYEKRVPHRLYYWKAGDAAATEIVSGSARHDLGHGRERQLRAALGGRRACSRRRRRGRATRTPAPRASTPSY
jgi:hypothetical protein